MPVTNTDEEIERFFRQPPESGPGQGTVRSILYLLRRDLRDLSIPEQRPANANDRMTAPVLACASMLIGLEVLGRIWQGKNKPVQMELNAAYQSLLGLDEPTAKLLIMFRNAIAHGYQLEHEGSDGTTYRFALGDHVGWQLWFEERTINGKTEYHVNCWELRERFLKAVETLRTQLLNPKEIGRRQKFEAVLQFLRPYHMVTRPASTKTVG